MNPFLDFQFAPVWHVAAKELRDRLRNRWVIVVTVVFALSALVIAYFGAAQQGQVGLRSTAYTIASLVSLVIYLIPLIALLLGFDAIVGERERGSLDLMLSMPITRSEMLLGKFCGLAAALSIAIVVGFGLLGGLLAWQAGAQAVLHYGGFMFSTLLLGLSFLSLAVMLSVFARDRARASGMAIALWFSLVLVYDLILLGVLVASGGSVGSQALPVLLLFNPADVFRLLNIFSLEDVKTLYGLSSVFPEHLASPWLLGCVMAGWIVIPMFIATWRFGRK